jgi:hypothetical protein
MKRPETILAPIAFVAAVVGLMFLLEHGAEEDPPAPTGARGEAPAGPRPAPSLDPGPGAPRDPAPPSPSGAPIPDPPRDVRLLPIPAAEGGEPPGPDAAAEEPGAAAPPTVWPATEEGIRGAMREALPRVRRCYEQALEEHPDLGGRITVDFIVGSSDTAEGVGGVTRAGIGDATIEHTVMDDCLLDALEGLQFDPPADGELEVSYPFLFSTE